MGSTLRVALLGPPLELSLWPWYRFFLFCSEVRRCLSAVFIFLFSGLLIWSNCWDWYFAVLNFKANVLDGWDQLDVGLVEPTYHYFIHHSYIPLPLLPLASNLPFLSQLIPVASDLIFELNYLRSIDVLNSLQLRIIIDIPRDSDCISSIAWLLISSLFVTIPWRPRTTLPDVRQTTCSEAQSSTSTEKSQVGPAST